MKVDYSKGKIYAIRSYSSDDVYIGSTCSTLTKRLSGHKGAYETWLKRDFRYATSYEVLKYGDAYIELVEECPCENKQQLLRREGEVMRSMNCVNKNVAGRTLAEWYQDNAERVVALRKVGYQKNKETIGRLQKEYRDKNQQRINENRRAAYWRERERIIARREHLREQNKEAYAAKRKAEYLLNKERLAQKVTCACGCVVNRSSLAGHKKTKKHEQYLNALQRELDEKEASTRQGAEAAGEGDQ
jgi:hypothetical protein